MHGDNVVRTFCQALTHGAPRPRTQDDGRHRGTPSCRVHHVRRLQRLILVVHLGSDGRRVDANARQGAAGGGGRAHGRAVQADTMESQVESAYNFSA